MLKNDSIIKSILDVDQYRISHIQHHFKREKANPHYRYNPLSLDSLDVTIAVSSKTFFYF